MRTDSIHCALRIRLKDLSCICLLSAELLNTITALRQRCIRHVGMVKLCPLQLVLLIIENTADALNSWVYRLWKRVDFLEDATGMTPRFHVARADSLSSRRLTILLRDLHAVHVELRIALTNVKSSSGLVPWLLSVMDTLETTRTGLGASALQPGHRAQLQDQANFNETVLLNMAEKVTQLLDRVNAQINVVRNAVLSMLTR
jgi:Mg2+ and Co2+ transporter CorA